MTTVDPIVGELVTAFARKCFDDDQHLVDDLMKDIARYRRVVDAVQDYAMSLDSRRAGTELLAVINGAWQETAEDEED